MTQPVFHLRRGAVVSVHMTQMSTPGDFFVVLGEKYRELDTMMEEMDEFYREQERQRALGGHGGGWTTRILDVEDEGEAAWRGVGRRAKKGVTAKEAQGGNHDTRPTQLSNFVISTTDYRRALSLPGVSS